MRELFRFFTTRAPTQASAASRRALGVALHGPFAVSAHHAHLRTLANDRPALEAAAAEFTRSAAFVGSIDALSPALAGVVDEAAAADFHLDATAARRAVDTLRLQAIFDPVGPFAADWNRVADSITALAVGRRLGVAKVPYLSIARTLAAIVHTATALRDGWDLSDRGLRLVLTGAVVVDPLLFRPCTPGAPTTMSPAPLDGQGREPRPPVPCTCKPDDRCLTLGRCCRLIEPYVADLLLLRETTLRYQVGDLAYIENVLRGETRTRDHRTLRRVEEFSETETTTTRTEERDHQVTERFSLETQASQVIQEDLAIDAGVNLTGKLGEHVTFSTSFGLSTSTSSTSTSEIARSYARDVVDRALTRVETAARELRSRRVTIETEEKNGHALDNVGGTDHIAGLYHWVDRVSRGQVMGYGKRLIFDLVIPEPAAPYKQLSTVQVTAPPAPPRIDLATIVAGPAALTRTSYLAVIAHPALARLDLSGIAAPPAEEVVITCAMSAVEQPAAEHAVPLVMDVKDLTVPVSYQATSFSVFSMVRWNEFQRDQFNQDDNGKDLFVSIGHTSAWLPMTQNAAHDLALPNLVGTLHVMANAWGANAVTVTIWVRCVLAPEAMQAWQLETYSKLKAAVLEHNRAADEAAAAPAPSPAYLAPRAPFFLREIERTELSRLALTMIACERFGRDAMKRHTSPCGYPDLDVGQAVTDGRAIQFLQQAFEWRFLTYVFYPYVWGAPHGWPEAVQLTHTDPMFEKFLRAGAARVTVPVREGFEELVAYYLATGEIWGGGDPPPVVGSDHYLSLLQELKEDRGCHFTDREGTLDVTAGSATVALTTSYYLDPADAVVAALVDNDHARELVLAGTVYRIVAITGGPTAWIVTLDRPYEGATAAGLPFLVGARFVGAPWEIISPTALVYLRNTTTPLPVYPL